VIAVVCELGFQGIAGRPDANIVAARGQAAVDRFFGLGRPEVDDLRRVERLDDLAEFGGGVAQLVTLILGRGVALVLNVVADQDVGAVASAISTAGAEGSAAAFWAGWPTMERGSMRRP